MLKKFLAIALSALCGHAWAQHATIETNNPSPRQGDRLEVAVTLERNPSAKANEPNAQPARGVGQGMFFFEKSPLLSVLPSSGLPVFYPLPHISGRPRLHAFAPMY